MNRMPSPAAASERMVSSRVAASLSVSTAVGSSKISRRAFFLSTSRAISTNCMWPTGSPAIGIHSSIESPTRSRAARASWRMVAMSRVSSVEPAIRDSGFARVGSRLSLMFSATRKPGISMNSWWTMPSPAAIASAGEAKRAAFPSSTISPP